MKHVIKKLIYLPILFLIFNLNTAYADQAAAMQLAALLKNIYSIQGGFKQIIYNNKGKIVQSSSGTMALQKPSKFRWEINYPNKQLIVSDGVNLWVYNKSLQQISVQPLKKNIATTPVLLLNAANQSIANYFIVQYSNGWFYLTARSKNSMFQQIKLQFNGNALQQMQLIDNLGQSGVLQFSSLTVNSGLSPALFQFTPPQGVDVVGTPK